MNKPAVVKKRASLGDYFRHVRAEVKKVVWPTKKELVSFTWVVIFICTVFALLFWGVDTLFATLIKLIFNI